MEQPHRPVVLVHGSYHGAWCWERVSAPLRAAGLTVHTPVCPGVGERAAELSRNPSMDDWALELVAYLDAHRLNEVVLVGHSLAGSPIAGVADRVPTRLSRLVFLDASIPGPGHRFSAAVGEQGWRQRLARRIEIDGVPCLPPPDPEYFGISQPADLAWVRARLTPMPVRLFDSPLTLRHPVGNGVDASFIQCMAPQFPRIADYAAQARALGWDRYELPTGHDAMVTAPTALAALLERLARRSE